jgi:hypothetical protein
MNKEKLRKHIKKLCIKNLRSDKVKCCGECPFEEIICQESSELKELFIEKKLKKIMGEWRNGLTQQPVKLRNGGSNPSSPAILR